MIDHHLIREPLLFFGNNQSTIDPKIGILNYGPYYDYGVKASQPNSLSAGIIATNRSYEHLIQWLDMISNSIEGKKIPNSNVRSVDFPGISKDNNLGFDVVINNSAIEIITKKELHEALKSISIKEKILNVFEIYKQKFSDMSGNHPRPNILFLPLDERFLKECKDPSHKQEKIIYFRRSEKIEQKNIPMFDFHNAIKVLSLKYGFVTQLIRPKTLTFSEELQDPATIAWNFSVAIYYKGTGHPWKLADIDENTCFVGLSFYKDISRGEKSLRTSMAHVYLKTGESQIIRGKSFHWDDKKDLIPSLPEDHAFQIIGRVISLYKRQKSKLPRRIVIHKTSPFSLQELSGFDQATNDIEIVDYIHISKFNDIKAYPVGYSYPVLRGTMFGRNDSWYLFTTGFVPSIATYPGAQVPTPLRVNCTRLDSSPIQVGKDIMSLTKLDWNTADFYIKEPVTIAVSRRVGSILAEIKYNEMSEPPEAYRYYM